jgi:hypothetical protein
MSRTSTVLRSTRNARVVTPSLALQVRTIHALLRESRGLLANAPASFEIAGEIYPMLNEEETFQKSSARSQDADPYLFAPESEMWRVNRERCGLIYGPAAAILQIAHPRIAQGVRDHSNFRTDIMGRLHRTLKSTNRIAFGRVSEAEEMKTRLAAVHRRVRGTVSPGIKVNALRRGCAQSSAYRYVDPDDGNQ